MILKILIVFFVCLSLAACSGTAIELAPSQTPEPSPTNTPIPSPTVTATLPPTASPTPTIDPNMPPAQAALGDTWTSPMDEMEMVYIPAGDFQMGCDPEHNGMYTCNEDVLPLHKVTLDAYWVDKTEVSNAQYALCVEAGACDRPDSTSSYSRSPYFSDSGYANYPVINVDWEDASNYCSWAGRELPSEAQWEKAARGESLRAYPWGDEEFSCVRANGYVWNSMCVGDTTEVGIYPQGTSPYGVLDMAGNVWEWVQDWYSETYYSSLEVYINPVGPSVGKHRVLRGGSFFSVGPVLFPSAFRIMDNPLKISQDYGFRCAVSSP